MITVNHKRYKMLDLLDMQKEFLLTHLRPGDVAVDFTMGNGHDTVFLSKTVGPEGKVYAFDIQQRALDKTRENLAASGCPDNWELILASHDRAPEFVKEKIRAGVFNLGYLPGSGNKALTTARVTTLPAVENAIGMLGEDSILIVAVYPGHPEGAAEGEALSEYLSSVSRFKYTIAQIKIVNSPTSPFFFTVESK
ncbi:MAG: methyltransferase domain-containing protein [Clostridia bacterium]|nr:methyltransferase domain-containing protein [Clostridia bacterium]